MSDKAEGHVERMEGHIPKKANTHQFRTAIWRYVEQGDVLCHVSNANRRVGLSINTF